MSVNKKVQRIGRSFGETPLARHIENSSDKRVFTLKSKQSATFTRQLILNSDIEDKTYVDPQVNGRDQSTITEESVKDIIRTIALQQFFPAIGRLKDGRIEIMDGSRRRAACLFSGANLEVLVTQDELSAADARQLAADIQTAKEHNLRELGLRFMIMHEHGMSKSDIARAENISNAKVTRAFQAASVPAEIIAIFPVVSELTLQDYQFLLDVCEEARAEAVEITDIVSQIENQLREADLPGETNPDEKKHIIMTLLRAAKRQVSKVKPQNRPVVEKLARFTDRNAYARKKINPDRRTVNYEFSRLPVDIADKIDNSIRDILKKMQ